MSKATVSKHKKFDTSKSITKDRKWQVSNKNKTWSIKLAKKEVKWSENTERIELIRKGLPYQAIEVISKKANLPIKQLLQLMSLPQTTYNKKKRENDILDNRDSETLLVLNELLEYGLVVFNNEEEKFQNWLAKANIALGGVAPKNLFDSLTGIEEVKNCLNRLEYGNLA